MDPLAQASLDEKARLQHHFDTAAAAAAEASPSHLQPLQLPSPASGGSSSSHHTNTVPMTEEELQQFSPPISTPHSPLPPQHQHQARSPTPPPYSGPSTSNLIQETSPPPPKGPQKYPGLPRLDYRLYSPPLFEQSADRTTIKSSAPYLSSNVSALVALVRSQSAVPPKPQIHITGRRSGHQKPDFAVKLNLMPLLVPDEGQGHQRWDYIRCVADGEVALRGGSKPSAEPGVGGGGGDGGGGGGGGLEDWAKKYVEDKRAVKSFTLERVVANLDANWLEGQIRSMIASTGYKGVVAVTFPVTHSKVVVQSPDRVNKFFTSVTTLLTGKNRYEVVKAVWPFATHKNGEQGRRCVVQSEETWWREWRDPIRYAISTKRQGWVTNEDKLEAIMEGVGKGVSTVDWGPEW